MRPVPPVPRITSRQHALVRRCRAIAARRRGAGAVLLDGEHLLAEALDADVPVTEVLTDRQPSEIVRRAGAAGAQVHGCTRAVIEAASPVRTPSGVLAIAEWRPAPLAVVFGASPALVAGLVDVQDPGNVGSAIRSADALGATGVVAAGSTADPSGWKVARGSMGSLFHLPVARADAVETIAAARAAGARVLATVARGAPAIDDVDVRGPALLLFGHEGAGLAPALVDEADARISVPMRSGVESLNVAVAVALVIDRARRQREGTADR
jgi:TrmH family RNA methyltransferase